jgi:integrase/recombinase XerC
LGSDRNIAAKRSKAPAGRAIGPANLGSDPNFSPLPPIADGLVQRYLQHVRVEKRLAARTVDLYAIDLQKLAEFAAKAKVDLLKVQTTHIRQWVARMHAGGRSPRGIALILSGWRGFYAWLGRESLVRHNPVVDVRAPKAAKPLPKALSVDDAVQLASFKRDSANPWLEARDAAMVELLYGSGLRVGELTGLDVAASKGARGWVDLVAAEAHVLGKGSKHRSVPMGGKTVEALTAWLAVRGAGQPGRPVRAEPAEPVDPVEAPSPALFIGRHGTRLTAQAIWQRLRARSLQAGLPMPVHPHMLRHSFASHVLQSSSDLRAVQELLGHANIGTTQVYTRLDFQHLAKTYDAAHPRAKLKR